jgi:antitoxin component of RelBE/YafQ-DinJ toxin-antitoxin module
MKSRLNITVDEELLNRAKVYAEQHQTSISQLVEVYLERLTKKPAKENLLSLVKQLKKPQISPDADLKKQYLEERKGKYGF